MSETTESVTDVHISAAAPERPAHRDPNVLRWVTAYTASMVGDMVFFLALSWAAVQNGTPAQAGLVTAVSAVPRALLMLGGGVVADRLGPRRVVIGSDSVRCVTVLAVAAVLFATDPGLWLLALLAVVFGTVDAVFMPAVGALPARITGKDQLARVQGMRGLAIRFAAVVGAPLGGLGVAVGGAAAAFAFAGLLIAVSVPLLVSVRMRDLPADDAGAARETTAWRDLVGGLRYVRRHRVLGPLMVTIALGDLGFVGPLNVGLTLLADERGWGASGMGWVLAGFGTGAGVAALLLTVRGRLPHAGYVAAGAIIPGAAAIAALAHAPALPVAVGTALLVGLLTGLSGAMCGALLQTQSDPAYLGRVTAVGGIVSLGIAPLSMPLSAAAIGVWGTGPVFAVSAAVCGLGGVVALCAPGVRRAELPK
ncbi:MULTISPECIES: MFS transporter [Streptomyces]|uniref:MFS transporter n=1 Tax=Streptomyces TaxID=1883 RepID=UPI001290CEC3|nr:MULTISPECIES: MFS transporter [Streptomyces]MCX5038422.1 MFS transporter [Streptomyces coelicoflavus]MDI6520284.1 MFS transporter [Streptomyces coelicoflavus]QFX84474.1 MFS transporter [Streptomyces sp. SYP-A7193]